MPRRQSMKEQLPQFASEEEEARFWDTHSTTDYPEYWVAEEKLEVERPLRHVLGVRLDAQVIDQIAALGRRKGLGVSTMARVLILERLAELEQQTLEEAHRKQQSA
ncbi:MAG: hypothetical protein EPO21_00435 [Chloroflexota bacterium]|nr:MAG: hypothetical protein EPO21_00435 [Chloroflexota bacterium]